MTNALQAAKLVTNLLLCLWLPVKEFESQSILSKVRIRSAGVHELHGNIPGRPKKSVYRLFGTTRYIAM